MNRTPITCNVAIVGGGTAGLALATELKRLGVKDVVVLERETQAGGVPRHCGHYPFGVFELKRLMKGPDYARKLVKNAIEARVDIRTSTTVTALHPDARLSLAASEGLLELQAKRVVLCTGVRESSRAQRFLSGQRPQGIISTGALQSMVYLHGNRPFKRPVILGTELVAFSAIATCRHLGIRPQAMLEENARVTVRQFMRPYPAIMGVPVSFGVRDLQIMGDKNVELISYTDQNGQFRQIEADGLIVSGKFRPEAALLHASHIEVDPASGGPIIDQYGRCSDPSYFSTGNLLRPVETSGWCWREAVAAAPRIVYDLANPIGNAPLIKLRSADQAIQFVIPQRLVKSDAPGAMENIQLRFNQPASGHLTAISDGKTLWKKFVSSRPERRVLVSLKPLLKVDIICPVELKIIGNT